MKSLKMMRMRDTIVGLLVFALIGTGIAMIYRYEQNKGNRELARRIAEISPRGGVPETIDGLRQAIAIYETQIERNVREAAQAGVYWKILAVRFADRNMHRDAIDALERALYYTANDPTLMFLTAESASVVASNALEFSVSSASEREHFYRLSESAYIKAIELDPGYAKPMLGLGILYTFDLDRPNDAIPHLQRYLELLSSDVKGMFVLARAYYMTDRYSEAVELYDRILTRSRDPAVRAEAQNNKEYILGSM